MDKEIIILLLAAVLDRLVGDPQILLHPVQVMGWIISRYTQLLIPRAKSKIILRLAGIFLAIGLITISAITAHLIIKEAGRINPLLAMAIEIIILASCFAGRSLRRAAREVLAALKSENLAAARARLSMYVGRDSAKLEKPEILRAVLETVAENTTDGATAPLFYAILGLLIPGVGCVPLAIAYKAASTLDSSIGYLREPYTDIGWFSARLEDLLTWLPCRLTVLTIAMLSGKPKQVWDLCRRDGVKDPSPNSGWSECAIAAALGVQLGGINYYGGVAKHKPLLGDRHSEITEEKIWQALILMRNSLLIWLAIAVLLTLRKTAIVV